MAPRRVYPSWLPPNPREREALMRLRRRQGGVIGWLIALLPVGWAIASTGSDVMLAPLTVFWIVLGVNFARRIVESPCPRCQERFCSRRALPYWYGLFNHRCENCGLSLEPVREADL